MYVLDWFIVHHSHNKSYVLVKLYIGFGTRTITCINCKINLFVLLILLIVQVINCTYVHVTSPHVACSCTMLGSKNGKWKMYLVIGPSAGTEVI